MLCPRLLDGGAVTVYTQVARDLQRREHRQAPHRLFDDQEAAALAVNKAIIDAGLAGVRRMNEIDEDGGGPCPGRGAGGGAER